MRLRWQLTDLSGAPKGGPFVGHFVADETTGHPMLGGSRQQGQVTVPVNDSRTGQLQISMYNQAAQFLTPGDTCVKALYGDQLVLWGIVLQPTSDFDAGTVTVTLHDSTIRLKHRFLRYGDASVTASIHGGAGIPLDGSGIRTLISDSEPPGGGVPGTGILLPGIDTVPAQPALVGGVPPAGALYVAIARGDNSWDDITNMVQAADGFEADYRPFDASHASLSGDPWAAGLMCELITHPLLGTDRSQGNTDGNAPVTFVHGRGGFHVVSAPDADRMRTYAVEVQPGGQLDPLDVFGIAKVLDTAAVAQYGLWEEWQSSGQIVGVDVLKNRGEAIVAAYAKPPKFLTARCDTDTPCGYQYGVDFNHGDIVTVFARKGYATVKENARITQVQIQQKDQDGNVSLGLDLVPSLIAGPGLTFE